MKFNDENPTHSTAEDGANTTAPYEPMIGDLAFLDAFRLGGEIEASLLDLEPKLWLKGMIGLETNRYASQISEEEFMKWLSGEGGWQANA